MRFLFLILIIIFISHAEVERNYKLKEKKEENLSQVLKIDIDSIREKSKAISTKTKKIEEYLMKANKVISKTEKYLKSTADFHLLCDEKKKRLEKADSAFVKKIILNDLNECRQRVAGFESQKKKLHNKSERVKEQVQALSNVNEIFRKDLEKLEKEINRLRSAIDDHMNINKCDSMIKLLLGSSENYCDILLAKNTFSVPVEKINALLDSYFLPILFYIDDNNTFPIEISQVNITRECKIINDRINKALRHHNMIRAYQRDGNESVLVDNNITVYEVNQTDINKSICLDINTAKKVTRLETKDRLLHLKNKILQELKSKIKYKNFDCISGKYTKCLPEINKLSDYDLFGDNDIFILKIIARRIEKCIFKEYNKIIKVESWLIQ